MTTETISTERELVERFQCPGCVLGYNANCGEYAYDPREFRCVSHILGTGVGAPGNLFALGLPKGFCKPGWTDDKKVPRIRSSIDVRLFPRGQKPDWNNLNVPVWAMVEDGFLFVRTFAPRVNVTWVDVIEGGTLDMVPNAIDVSTFIDEID